MNIQPKLELGPPPGFDSINPNNKFENMSIHELIKVLRGTYQWRTFDTIEAVLESRSKRLREDLQMEKLSRLHAEAEFKKREEMCERGQKVQESYEALLKEIKVNRLADTDTIEELRMKNNELEGAVEKLKEKCFNGSNDIGVLRRKNGELESRVLELSKLKEKWVEDTNELGVLRKMYGKLEDEVLELRKSKKIWLDNSNALDELRNKVCVLEGEKNALAGLEITNGELKETVKINLETISGLEKEKSKLADEKKQIEVLLGSLYKKFRGLIGRVSSLEDQTKLLMNVGASGGGNNEGEPADPMVAASEEKDEADDLENVFRNDTVQEAGPSQRNEAVQQPLGVAASTQPHSNGSKDAQGASSASVRVKLEPDIEIINVPARGRVILQKGIEIIDLDDSDDDDDQSMSRAVQKKAISGIAVKIGDPSSSVATQQNSKIANVVDTVKRKFSFTDIETFISTSTSSDDSSSLDDLPISVVSLGKKKKM